MAKSRGCLYPLWNSDLKQYELQLKTTTRFNDSILPVWLKYILCLMLGYIANRKATRIHFPKTLPLSPAPITITGPLLDMLMLILLVEYLIEVWLYCTKEQLIYIDRRHTSWGRKWHIFQKVGVLHIPQNANKVCGKKWNQLFSLMICCWHHHHFVY